MDTFFAGGLIVFPGKLAGLEPRVARDAPTIYYAQATLPATRLGDAATLGAAKYPAGEPVYLAGKGAHVPQTEIAAVLGNAFFHDSVLTLDFQSDRLLVTPGHGGAQSGFPLGTGL